jgi:hypothetical protein
VPDNVAPGSLIPCIAAPKLGGGEITAKLDLGNRKFIMWESFFFFNFEVVDPF